MAKLKTIKGALRLILDYSIDSVGLELTWVEDLGVLFRVNKD